MFGGDPHRYADARARKNYAGMAPITRASGTKRVVARYARNKRLADAPYQQAFAALTKSPGARAFYDRRPSRRRHPPPGLVLSLGQADDLAWHVLRLSSQVHAPVLAKRLAQGDVRGAAEAFLDYLAGAPCATV